MTLNVALTTVLRTNVLHCDATWKLQMKHLLLAKRLWEHVDRTDDFDNATTAQARAEFVQKSQKAFSTIVLAISTNQLYLVASCDGPHEAWEALRTNFECDTLANKLLLKKTVFQNGNTSTKLEAYEGTYWLPLAHQLLNRIKL